MNPRYRALLIGNSSYPEDEATLPALNGPVNDVPAMRRVLEDREYGMFDSADISTRIEQSSFEVQRTLDDFFSSAVRDDVLLLYFSGHGRLDEYGKLYLCARNTATTRLRSTAISSDQINEMIDATAAGYIVVILDCCHSGAFKGQDFVTPLAPAHGRGRYVIAGCRARQLANDGTAQHHLSLFTANLVEGMVRQQGTLNGRPYVSLDELYDFVYQRVTTSSRQTPQKSCTAEGTLAIARRARPFSPLSLSRDEISLRDLYEGETLPAERVRVFGLGDGDKWQVTTEVPWISIEQSTDYFDLLLTPPSGLGRANVEVLRRRTGEAKILRVRTMTSSVRLVFSAMDTAPAADPPVQPAPPTPSGRASVPSPPPSARRAAKVAPRARRATLFVRRVEPWSVAVSVGSVVLVTALLTLPFQALMLIPLLRTVVDGVPAALRIFIAAAGIGYLAARAFISIQYVRRQHSGHTAGITMTLTEVDLGGASTPARDATLALTELPAPWIALGASLVATLAYWIVQILPSTDATSRPIIWPLAVAAATAISALAYERLPYRRRAEVILVERGAAAKARRARLLVNRLGFGRLLGLLVTATLIAQLVWKVAALAGVPPWIPRPGSANSWSALGAQTGWIALDALVAANIAWLATSGYNLFAKATYGAQAVVFSERY